MNGSGAGRPPVFREAMAEFVQSLASLEGDALRRRCMAEFSTFTSGQYKLNTARVYISRYRSAISKVYGKDHPALAIFVPVAFHKEDEEAMYQTKPSARQEAVETFADAMAAAADDEERKALWEKELGKLASLTDNTKKFYISRYYRPVLAEKLGENHPAHALIRLPRTISDKITREYRTRIVEQNRTLIHIPLWRELVQAVTQAVTMIVERSLSDDESMVRLGAALLLLTGRRPYEIFCCGVFERASLQGGAAGARSKWSVLFSGQAKTRGRQGTSFGGVQEIPVLAPASLVLTAMCLFRTSRLGLRLIGMANTNFSKLTTSRGREDGVSLRQAVHSLYGNLWPRTAPLSPKCLRPLYAEISYRFFATPALSKNSFFARILGHSSQDLVTSLSYMDYYLEAPEQALAVCQRVQKRVEEQQKIFEADRVEREN